MKYSIFIQEPVFSCVSAILYTLSSALLSRTVFIHLFHFYTKIPNFTAYPALTGAYVSKDFYGLKENIFVKYFSWQLRNLVFIFDINIALFRLLDMHWRQFLQLMEYLPIDS